MLKALLSRVKNSLFGKNPPAIRECFCTLQEWYINNPQGSLIGVSLVFPYTDSNTGGQVIRDVIVEREEYDTIKQGVYIMGKDRFRNNEYRAFWLMLNNSANKVRINPGAVVAR